MDTAQSNGGSVAFIGAGAMGAAMIGGLAGGNDIDAGRVIASDRNEDRLALVRDQFGVRTTHCNREAARDADIVVLAVKPQVLPAVLSELQGRIREDALTLSIVAGATIASIASLLEHRAIVRTMPNTPAQVGEGMTVWTATPEVSREQRAQAVTIVGALGRQLFVDDERFLDIATAISGTGPAYVFLMMEALVDAAVHLGFSRKDARELVVQTIRGAGDLRAAAAGPSGRTAQSRDFAGRHHRRGAVPAREGQLPDHHVQGGPGRVQAQRGPGRDEHGAVAGDARARRA